MCEERPMKKTDLLGNLKKQYTKEPIIHSGITDELPEEHQLSHKMVYCDSCEEMIHAGNNECMQVWIETELGNFRAGCWKLAENMYFLSDNLDPQKIRRTRGVGMNS